MCAVQLTSLKVETERIQAQKDQAQAELAACRSELDALRVALSHVQGTSRTLSKEKVNPESAAAQNITLMFSKSAAKFLTDVFNMTGCLC